MSRSIIMPALAVLVLGLSACSTSSEPTPEPATEAAEPQRRTQPQPQAEQPEPQPQAEVQQQQPAEAVEEKAEQFAQQQPMEADSKLFIGESFSEVDSFTGAQTTVIGVEGDGAFPYDGWLLIGCWSEELWIILAEIPYVDSDSRRGDLLWVTPSRVGNPGAVSGVFFDSDGGDRNWRRHFDWAWTDPSFTPTSPTASSAEVATFLSALIAEGQVTVRLQTYDEVFGATFDFGDITAAEHWGELADCES